MQEINEFMSLCDYVVNALPSTPQTRELLGLPQFSRCRPGAVFINIGRGDILREERDRQPPPEEGAVIIEALGRGYLAGAVLDVFRSEPLSPQSGLWSTPGVELTPHVAAISFARDVARLFRDNLQRYVDGRELRFPASWSAGY